MTDRMSVGHLFPVSPASPKRQPSSGSGSTNGKTFEQILQDARVRFSHHAEQRLRQRGIQLKPEQMTKLNSAIDQAASKGAKESLMLFQDLALIVNVQNRTVVTALDGASMKNNIFTQIDSAVIIS